MIGDASSEEDNSHETDAGVFDDAAQVQDFSAQAQLHLNEPSHGTDPAGKALAPKDSARTHLWSCPQCSQASESDVLKSLAAVWFALHPVVRQQS